MGSGSSTPAPNNASTLAGFPTNTSEVVAVTSKLCPHCVALQSTLDQLPKKVRFRQIDSGDAATDPSLRAFLSAIQAPGYVPFIALVRYNGNGDVAHSTSYRGPRDLASILEFAEFHARTSF